MKPLLLGALLLVLPYTSFAQNHQASIEQFYCLERSGDGNCALYRASILNLVITPERFQGKKVQVYGYLNLGNEGSSLFYSKNSYYTESVCISFDDGPMETKEDVERIRKKHVQISAKYNHRVVLAEGIFEILGNGGIVCPAALTHITRIGDLSRSRKMREK